MKESDSNTTWSDVEVNISSYSKWTSEECIAESEEFVKKARRVFSVPSEYGIDHDYGEVVFRWNAQGDQKDQKCYLSVIFRKDKRGPYTTSYIGGSRSYEELKPGDIDFDKVFGLLLKLEHLSTVRNIYKKIEQNVGEFKKKAGERAKDRTKRILKSLETASSFGPHTFDVDGACIEEVRCTVDRLNRMGLRASIDELKRGSEFGKTSANREMVIKVTVINPDAVHEED